MGAGVVQASTLECLSTSALLPCAETGTLWERAGSGSLYTQGMEGELRKQTPQWICQINDKRSQSKATSFKLTIDVVYFNKHKVIYDCSHSYLTISHMIHQHYTCCSQQFQLLEKRVRTSDVRQ